jgi:chromosome partitioning protein
MFTISLLGQKGGSGKTTIAIGLAVAAARRGVETAIIDLDPQASASKWKDRRQDENPAVVSAQASRLKPVLETARSTGAQIVIIDTAGRKDDSAIAAARSSDLVLIPVRPNIVELETLPDVSDLLALADNNPLAFVVLNCVHPSTGPRGVTEIHAAIKRMFDLTVCPPYISLRAAYAEAPTSGQAPQEIDQEGKAAGELQRLFNFTCEFVNMRTWEPTHGYEHDENSGSNVAGKRQAAGGAGG